MFLSIFQTFPGALSGQQGCMATPLCPGLVRPLNDRHGNLPHRQGQDNLAAGSRSQNRLDIMSLSKQLLLLISVMFVLIFIGNFAASVNKIRD
ncbi:MAG: hypothetical protein WCP34_08045 [Pseudomonadota bacterium]